MDFGAVDRALEQLVETWHSLSHAGASNFRERRWKSQRDAMGARVALADQAVESLMRAADRSEWPASWEAFCQRILDAKATLPSPFYESLLFAVSQRVLSSPDRQLLLRIPRPTLASVPQVSREVIGAPADLARHVVDQLQRQQNLADSKEDVARLADLLARRFFQSEALRLAYLPMLFYRNQHAYLFGRVGEQPVCIPLVNPSHAGPRVDALLVGEAEVTRVVEFSRSPFLAECPEPEAVVGFLRSLLPGKDPAQLTMNLGFRLWGQALLVSQWEEYLSSSGVQLEHAPGTPGLVMLAFCAGDFPIVFKVARDRPRPPKTITRAGVMERYAFVTRQDRVGRMADAHHFRAWSFPRKAFAPKLWEEMVREAGGCFRIQGDEVVLEDLITERRLEPLNLRLREERATDLPGLVLDYGRAIKEMAMSNIFPGDLLLKNFGVTPTGRVVFYDYDEVCALTECVFRNLPVARREEDELSAEPWFHVGPNDVFPEELRRFIVPPGAGANPFLEQHADLFQTAFWQQWKDFHDAGGLVDLQPY